MCVCAYAITQVWTIFKSQVLELKINITLFSYRLKIFLRNKMKSGWFFHLISDSKKLSVSFQDR